MGRMSRELRDARAHYSRYPIRRVDLGMLRRSRLSSLPGSAACARNRFAGNSRWLGVSERQAGHWGRSLRLHTKRIWKKVELRSARASILEAAAILLPRRGVGTIQDHREPATKRWGSHSLIMLFFQLTTFEVTLQFGSP